MDDPFEAAVSGAIQNNNLLTARQLLAQHLYQFPDDAQAWRQLAYVVEQPEQREEALWRAREAEGRLAAPDGWPAGSRQLPTEHPPAQPLTSQSTVQPGRVTWPRLALTGGWVFFSVAAIICLLVAAACLPMLLGQRTFVLLSGSMAPALPMGTAVVAGPVPSAELRVGDILVYRINADGTLPVVHRIVDIHESEGARHFTTRGDANAQADNADITLPATAWRVRYGVPLAGYAIVAATSPAGVLVLVVLPVIALVSLSALDWVKRRRPAAHVGLPTG